MGSVRRGHNKAKGKLTRDNNGKFGRTTKRTRGSKDVPEKAVGVLVKRHTTKKKVKQPVKIVKPSKVVHKHHSHKAVIPPTVSDTLGSAKDSAAEVSTKPSENI